VLVGGDAAALGEALRASQDSDRRERLLGVMVGDLADPAVTAASAEMAGELWRWASAEQPGGILGSDASAHVEGQDPPGDSHRGQH